MIARLAPILSILILCATLFGCASNDSKWGKLPSGSSANGANVHQLLQQADKSPAQQAVFLRLEAADLAYKQSAFDRSTQVLAQIPWNQMKPGQQVFYRTLQAQIALSQNDPKSALNDMNDPSMKITPQLPKNIRARVMLTRADALAANGQIIEAAQERVRVNRLLSDNTASVNDERIWELMRQAPTDQLKTQDSTDDYNGWVELALINRDSSGRDQQVVLIESWRKKYSGHPANAYSNDMILAQAPSSPIMYGLPTDGAGQLQRIGLLLPESGALTNVGQALRNGFLAANSVMQQKGVATPTVILYDSTKVKDLKSFYAKAQSDNIQWVVGPVEKNLVKQLTTMDNLAIPTLALNYNEQSLQSTPKLYQFGLAAEDDANEVANLAWSEGKKQALIIVPEGEWGNRVAKAFVERWQGLGGVIFQVVEFKDPESLSNQLSSMVGAKSNPTSIDSETPNQTTPIPIIAPIPLAIPMPESPLPMDMVFIAASAQQTQQILMALSQTNAAQVPVFATSHFYNGPEPLNVQSAPNTRITFCETPWMLNPQDNVRQQITKQWPQAKGSMGRLYAMGADAYFMLPKLEDLQVQGSYPGLTGTLTMSNQRIGRRMPCATYQQGVVTPLPKAM